MIQITFTLKEADAVLMLLQAVARKTGDGEVNSAIGRAERKVRKALGL